VGSNTTNSNGVAVFKYVPSKTGSLSVIASSAANSSVTSGAEALTVTAPTNYTLYAAVAAVVIVVIAVVAAFYYARGKNKGKGASGGTQQGGGQANK